MFGITKDVLLLLFCFVVGFGEGGRCRAHHTALRVHAQEQSELWTLSGVGFGAPPATASPTLLLNSALLCRHPTSPTSQVKVDAPTKETATNWRARRFGQMQRRLAQRQQAVSSAAARPAAGGPSRGTRFLLATIVRRADPITSDRKSKNTPL